MILVTMNLVPLMRTNDNKIGFYFSVNFFNLKYFYCGFLQFLPICKYPLTILRCSLHRQAVAQCYQQEWSSGCQLKTCSINRISISKLFYSDDSIVNNNYNNSIFCTNRDVESDIPRLLHVTFCCHSICLFFYGVRRICRIKKGKFVKHTTSIQPLPAVPDSLIYLTFLNLPSQLLN